MKNKPLIFISYHSDDQLYTDLILAQLNKISEKYPFTVLTSQDIEIGESDRSSIRNSLEKHIQNARAALILISPSYLSSQWNGSEELSLILDEHTERGLRAIPIIIDPSYWVDTPLVYHQLLPKDGRPL
ncbi:MAG: toll/interleukin-1 receptor domain-containing protein, partial [Halobacteriota archaeon]